IPDLARRLHISRAALETRIGHDFPGVATALREWPAVAPAAYGLISSQAASVADFKKIDGIGYSGLYWLALGPGIVLLLLSGAGLRPEWQRMRSREIADHTESPQPAAAA